jgi:hypothetical protein
MCFRRCFSRRNAASEAADADSRKIILLYGDVTFKHTAMLPRWGSSVDAVKSLPASALIPLLKYIGADKKKLTQGRWLAPALDAGRVKIVLSGGVKQFGGLDSQVTEAKIAPAEIFPQYRVVDKADKANITSVLYSRVITVIGLDWDRKEVHEHSSDTSVTFDSEEEADAANAAHAVDAVAPLPVSVPLPEPLPEPTPKPQLPAITQQQQPQNTRLDRATRAVHSTFELKQRDETASDDDDDDDAVEPSPLDQLASYLTQMLTADPTIRIKQVRAQLLELGCQKKFLKMHKISIKDAIGAFRTAELEQQTTLSMAAPPALPRVGTCAWSDDSDS